jgi:hypothetical protein
VYNENKDFIIKSFFKIDQLLLSGRVAFGDPVTAYINQVADEILKDKPELHVQLKFYHIKSPQLNASSTPQGIILVNTGAFAYLQNEAQLAFILCHEIAHYVKDHALNSYTENQQALKGKGIYGSISLDEQIELYFNHSHEKEMEADSLGVALFLETGYDPAEITSALHLFHYYYLPFGNKPFNVNFFNKEEFTIPYIYFKDSLSPVSIVEKESDEYKTHPNISKRKTAVDSLLYGKHLSGSKYLVSEPSFKNLSTFCRFESLRLDILQKNYTKALYSSYLLLDEYPGNEFLETCIAKSLYGLTKFRNSEEFHLVTSHIQR